LLASDFDNTLVYTEEALRRGDGVPELTEKNRAALEYFMAEGGKFAVATGRALAAFAVYIERTPMNAPCIVCNGAAMYDYTAGEYLETNMLDAVARERGQQVLDAFPAVAAEAYHIDNVIHGVNPNEVTRNHERLTRVTVTEAPSLLEVPLPLGKILFEGEHEELLKVQSFLHEKGWDAEYELIFSGKSLFEMTVKGATKGDMVRRLAERLGISMDHVYCAGDEANDISMLTVAAQGFAPANCIEAVRNCGATIVSHAKDDAIADIIAILDKKYA